jgi:hypothetical protein
MTSPLKSRQSPLLLITPGGVDCKIALKNCGLGQLVQPMARNACFILEGFSYFKAKTELGVVSNVVF